jgi:hypothetical protein
MKNRIIIITTLGIALLLVCNDDNLAQPITKNENTSTRLSDPNPNAWSNSPMDLIISDFQESDGIFSSFICDEINKRIKSEPLKSLQELDAVDKKSRKYAFKICFSSEAGDFSGVLNSISGYSNKYPELVDEIRNAAK